MRLMRWSNKGKPLVNIKSRANKSCIHYREETYSDKEGGHRRNYCALLGHEHTCGYQRKVGECPRRIKDDE